MVTQKQIDADKDPKLLDSAMWEFRRWQAAVAAMQGMLFGVVGHIGQNNHEVTAYSQGPCNSVIADRACVVADVLIATYRKAEKEST